MITDTQLALIANVLGVAGNARGMYAHQSYPDTVMLLVVAYHYVTATPHPKAN